MRGAENVYWMFSAAAQTVAAFVAFLLAGYALVQAMMDTAAATDETLFEIHESLKQRYHRQLSVLVVMTALAILSSLGVVYLNAFDSILIVLLGWVAGGLSAAAILGGVGFVVSIVDPKKYRKAAERMAHEVRPSREAGVASSEAFFVKFVALEKSVRDLWERTGGERLRRRQGPPSVREMLEALRIAEVIPGDLYERLVAVNRHRNLVFHGQVHDIGGEIVQELDRASEQLAGIG